MTERLNWLTDPTKRILLSTVFICNYWHMVLITSRWLVVSFLFVLNSLQTMYWLLSTPRWTTTTTLVWWCECQLGLAIQRRQSPLRQSFAREILPNQRSNHAIILSEHQTSFPYFEQAQRYEKTRRTKKFGVAEQSSRKLNSVNMTSLSSCKDYLKSSRNLSWLAQESRLYPKSHRKTG